MKPAAAAILALALQDALLDLFNGKELAGRVPMKRAEWAVEEGLLTPTGKGGNGRPRTEKMHKDFELSLEWKTTAASTSPKKRPGARSASPSLPHTLFFGLPSQAA